MPRAASNIDGVWRESWANYTCINGVMRESDQYDLHNGVLRKIHDGHIDLSSLIGFRIVYTYDPMATDPERPWLRSTKELPVRMLLTGEHRGSMDTSRKGVVYEYDREMPYNEGICLYRGILYAEFPDDLLIALNPRAEHIDLWSTFKLADLNVQITGYETYEDTGYFASGWNSIFRKDQFLDPSDFPDKEPHKNIRRLNTYSILPTESRDDVFSPDISIGISRNLTTTDRNMVGSYGILDHTYDSIYVDGKPMPFVVEIYH